jgi:glycosyltransferase involved in cell wall biosynthesis
LRILHVANGYWPAIGGTEFLIQKVSEHLVALFGDEVTVYAPNGYNCEAFRSPTHPTLPSGSEVINGVTVRRFKVFAWAGPVLRYLQQIAYLLRLPGNDRLRTLYNGPIIRGLEREIAAFPCDVVAASAFPMRHMFYAVRARQMGGAPTVLIGALHIEEPWGFDRPMIYQAIRQADAYIAYTDFERDFLVTQKGIPTEKITVIGVGVDAERFARTDGTATRAHYGWENEPVVAFIGQQSRDKGVDTLVQAMPRVWDEFPTARLLIAGGRTEFSPQLRRMVAALPPGQRSQVIIVDGFSEDEKPALFAACDVFASPSRYESFGIVYLEAWAAGKPVIGCRSGAVSTVIADGQDGLSVPHGDSPALASALLTLLRDHALRWEMGERGRAKVRANYTWEKVTHKFRAVYERAVRSSKHGGTSS